MSSDKRQPPIQLELALDMPPARAEAAPAPAPRNQVKAAAAPRNQVKPAAAPARPGLRVIQGGGQRVLEPLDNRNAVIRVLVEAGADLLLKRISPLRAEEIERNVDRILGLFDQVDETPALMPILRRELDDLEALMAETRAQRPARRNV